MLGHSGAIYEYLFMLLFMGIYFMVHIYSGTGGDFMAWKKNHG